MERWKRGAARVGGFGSSVALSGLASLLVIPVIIRFAGEEAWAAIAVGQTVGAVLAIVSGLGWAQTGPTEVARDTREGRATSYRESVVLRLASLGVTIPVAVIACVILRPNDSVVASVAALGTTLVACGGAWFFIGVSSPAALMRFDTIPRVGGLVVGATLTVLTGSALAAATGFVLGPGLALVLSTVHVTHRYGAGEKRSIKVMLHGLRRQIDGIGIATFSATYLSFPLLFLSSAHPLATAQYALVDRMKQQSMSVTTPLAQTLQGWVPHASGEDLRARVLLTAKLAIGAAALGGIVFSCFAPLAGLLLGAGAVSVGFDLSVPIGIAFGLNVATLILGGSCLLPLGASRTVFWSAVAGTIAIVPALMLSSVAGPVGIAWAVAVAQLAVASVQVTGLIVTLRRQPKSAAGGSGV